ncbi:MAG: hypothetical protein WBA63_11405 [Thermomicrobiales bacterium]
MHDPRRTSSLRSRSAHQPSTSDSAARLPELQETAEAIDGLDAELDRMARDGEAGSPANASTPPGLAGLVATAAWVRQVDATAISGSLPEGGLDADQKSAIWATMMRGQSHVAATPEPPIHPARTSPQLGLVAGPVMPSNPLSLRGARRAIPAWTRAHVDLQPAVTVLLVAALLVAIAAGFRSFGGAGNSLVTPTASAHGAEGIAASASPNATAEAAECTVDGHHVLVAGNRAPYGYEQRGSISDTLKAELPDVLARFAGCMGGPNYDGLAQVATWRFVTELRSGIAGTPADISGATHRAEAIQHLWVGPIPATSEPLRLTMWTASNGEQVNLNVFLDTAQRLSDGRIGVLATIAPDSMPPVPDEEWILQRHLPMLSVWFIGLQETSAGPLVDELFKMCDGSDCVPMFGADAATPVSSPEASPVASPVS